MKGLTLKCVKCSRVYEYSPALFTCTYCNSPEFTNLLLHDPDKILSQTDFEEKTPCYKIALLNHHLNTPGLCIKDETFNRFGTMKDRRSKILVKIAEHFGFKKIFCVTGGNLANSLGEFAMKSDIECISVAPKDIPKKILAKLGQKTILTQIETLFDPAQIWTAQKIAAEFPAALDGTSNNPCAILAYGEIFHELKEIAPDFIVVPLGSGELFCGLCQEIEKAGLKTKVIGVSVAGKNPIGPAIRQNADELKLAQGFHERAANKISAIFTPILPIIINFLSKGHNFIEISDEEMRNAVFEFQPYFECAIEPSSLSVFAAIEKLNNEEKMKKIVCVLTGRMHATEVLKHK